MQFKFCRKDLKSFQTLFNSCVTQPCQWILCLHDYWNLPLTLAVTVPLKSRGPFLLVDFKDIANFIKPSNWKTNKSLSVSHSRPCPLLKLMIADENCDLVNKVSSPLSVKLFSMFSFLLKYSCKTRSLVTHF